MRPGYPKSKGERDNPFVTLFGLKRQAAPDYTKYHKHKATPTLNAVLLISEKKVKTQQELKEPACMPWTCRL